MQRASWSPHLSISPGSGVQVDPATGGCPGPPPPALAPSPAPAPALPLAAAH